MKRTNRMVLLLMFAGMLIGACSKQPPRKEDEPSVGTSTKIEGDSMLYGLACEGCTDSVLVFLPGTGGDPVTFDIIDATLQHKVIGRPKTGDWTAVVLNRENRKKADMVINLDELKGQWVSLVAPTLRHAPTALVDGEEEQAEFDSLLQERLKPIEMGFALKRHYVAQPIGTVRAMSTREDDPVVFPQPRRYMEWHVYNGLLVLKVRPTHEDSLKNRLNVCDTAEFLMLTRDSLRLRFKDGDKGYYRKSEK